MIPQIEQFKTMIKLINRYSKQFHKSFSSSKVKFNVNKIKFKKLFKQIWREFVKNI